MVSAVRQRPTGVAGRLSLHAADLAGRAVGQVLGGVAALRRGKPLHPRGTLHEATLTRHGGGRRWGVPFVDEAGADACVVRISRATGLPEPLPDIHGVAVRVPGAGGPVDLLFATTGTGRLSRYVLKLRRSARTPMTTMMPLRAPAGALQLGLTPAWSPPGTREWVMSAASPASARWEPFARLVAREEPVGPEPDPPLRFDPVRHIPEGTRVDRWIELVRDPAYVLSRRRGPLGTDATA